MSNLEFYIPDDIPPEVLAYGSELKQLGVGKAGKIGALILRFEQDLERGKTVVKENLVRTTEMCVRISMAFLDKAWSGFQGRQTVQQVQNN